MSEARRIADERLASGEISIQEHEALIEGLSGRQNETRQQQSADPEPQQPQAAEAKTQHPVSDGTMYLWALGGAAAIMIPFRLFAFDGYTNLLITISGFFMSPGERFFLPILADRERIAEDFFLGYAIPFLLFFSFLALPIAKGIREEVNKNSARLQK